MTEISYPNLDAAGRRRIREAVARAEEQSSGEILTIFTARSDDYHDVALIWSAVAALTALVSMASFSDFCLSLLSRLLGHWSEGWQPRDVLSLASTIAMLAFFGFWLILQWRPLRLWLTPAVLKQKRVRARAVTCFKVGAERRTVGSTGILIYLSFAEHRAEIVADSAIAAKVSPEVWGDALATLLSGIKSGNMAEGLAGSVEKVGAVLAEHFPRSSADRNEIPDSLIEV